MSKQKQNEDGAKWPVSNLDSTRDPISVSGVDNGSSHGKPSVDKRTATSADETKSRYALLKQNADDSQSIRELTKAINLEELLIDLPTDPNHPEFTVLREIRRSIEQVFQETEEPLIDFGDDINELDESIWNSNPYILFTKLGQGTMGELFTATNSVTGRKLAFKRVKIRASGSEGAEDKLRLFQEAQALMDLHRVNNTISGYVLRKTGPKGFPGIPGSANEYFLVSEFVDGVDLKQNDERWKNISEGLMKTDQGGVLSAGEVMEWIEKLSLGKRNEEEIESLKSMRIPTPMGMIPLRELPASTVLNDADIFQLQQAWNKMRVHVGVGIAIETLRALEEVHKAGYTHRDVKPSNVMVDKNGEVKLIDFGLSKKVNRESAKRFSSTAIELFQRAKQEVIHTDATQNGAIVGTPQYMDPTMAAKYLRAKILGDTTMNIAEKHDALKHILSEYSDGRSGRSGKDRDVYAVGLILYQQLSGRHPYAEANTAMEMLAKLATTTNPKPVQMKNPHLNPKLAAIVNKMLKKNPEERISSAREVRLALQKYLQQEDIEQAKREEIYSTITSKI